MIQKEHLPKLQERLRIISDLFGNEICMTCEFMNEDAGFREQALDIQSRLLKLTVHAELAGEAYETETIVINSEEAYLTAKQEIQEISKSNNVSLNHSAQVKRLFQLDRATQLWELKNKLKIVADANN